MHHPPPTDRLLSLLRAEADQLAVAVEHAAGVHAALRKGDMTAVSAALPGHEEQAAALRRTASERQAAAAELAAAVGLPADGVTLAGLADRLPEPQAGPLLAARDRLRELSAELISYQTGNANLIRYLRSYFHGVLGGPTADAPVRYGPSGTRVDPPSGIRVLARG